MLRNLVIIAVIVGGAFYLADYLHIGKDKTYDVYYYPVPGANAEYIGRVQGIRECRQQASRKAQMGRKQRFTNDYTCCLVTEKSKCERNDQ
ncbi:MAG: hypothetical protein EB060_08335 [Proteobacteria bacterium]|nr:hypothetical protein [Pseudomonadota bacterium]